MWALPVIPLKQLDTNKVNAESWGWVRSHFPSSLKAAIALVQEEPDRLRGMGSLMKMENGNVRTGVVDDYIEQGTYSQALKQKWFTQ
jgi:hypothetical protein